MGWSIGYLPPKEKELLNSFFLAVGKCLYFACAYEIKCKFVARLVKSIEELKKDPALCILDVAKSLKDNPLCFTIKNFPDLFVSEEEIVILLKAKDARNFIAHEVTTLVSLEASTSVLEECEEKLRESLKNLLAGDNIVSKWVYEIEEKEAAPKQIQKEYTIMALNWVFGRS